METKNGSLLLIFLTILLLSLCIVGCKDRHSHSNCIEVGFEKNIGNFRRLSLGHFNCDISYIALETDKLFLKAAAISAFNSDYILVSDRNICLLYRRNGKFMYQIGAQGKGPGEYNYIAKLQFGMNSDIFINDGSCFLVYNLNGDFLYKFRPEINPKNRDLGNSVSSFAVFRDSLFIANIRNDSGYEKYRAVIFDKYGRTKELIENHNIINKAVPYSISENGDSNIYRLCGNIYMKDRVSDTVYRVSEEFHLEPVYYINLGNYGMPRDIRELRLSQISKKRMEYIDVYQVFGTKDYFFMSCAFHNNHPIKDRKNLKLACSPPNWAWAVLGVYDNNSNELAFAKANIEGNQYTTAGFDNDYDGGISFFPDNQVNESTLSMWVDVNWLKEHVASDYFKESKPRYSEKKMALEELSNRLNVNDNPVLILCTFNNN